MKKIITLLVVVAVLGVLTVSLAGGYIYASSKEFLNNKLITKEITIEKGHSYAELYKDLFDNVSTPLGFDIYLKRVVKLPQNMKFGYYYADNITYSQLIHNIKNGIQTTIKVTVPEGFNLFDIANAVDKAGITKRDDFLSAVFNKNIVKEVTGQDYTSLEGFLFPGTYFFPKNASPKVIINTMYGDFKKNLPANFKEKVAAHGLSEYEAIILASIVQKETYNIIEAPVVASVYYNRLNIDMILQADPTILYGKFLRGHYEINISKQDLRDETNRYNTYKRKGLTPTPICNPSLIALEAVANPANTKYLFFVASKDGEHLFSETYDIHRRYVNEHQKNR